MLHDNRRVAGVDGVDEKNVRRHVHCHWKNSGEHVMHRPSSANDGGC